MAIQPRPIPSTRLALHPFLPEHADDIAEWIQDEQEAYWLAPRSRVPLNARRVIEWGDAEGERYVLQSGAGDVPLAYGEVNRLSRDPGTYWLGHLVVAPHARGHGYGQQLTKLLLDRGFGRGARRITLVVFPDNELAIHAYERAGLKRDGYETHYFPIYRRNVRLIRMAMSRSTWEA